MGIRIDRARDGDALARMTVTDRMVDGHGIAYGGYVFLPADTAFAGACDSHGPMTVASGAGISFVTSARRGDELVAAALERTRRGSYDVTVYREVAAEFRSRTIVKVQ